MSRRHPNSPRFGRHFTVGGGLAPGTVVGASGTVREVIPIYGLLRGRIRAKLSVAGGTFSFKYVKPVAGAPPAEEFPEDGSSLHAAQNPADLVLTDTAEGFRDIDDFYGEAFLDVLYTDDGDGSTIEQVTFSGV